MNLVVKTIPALMQLRLRTALVAERQRDPVGIIRSNSGGWHSQSDLQHRGDFQPLVVFLEDVTGLSVVELWGNINPPGAANRSHKHHGCDVSAVVYANFPEDSGALVFDNGLKLFPTPGLVLFFPPNEAHAVEPNASSKPRISFSANLKERKDV